MQAGDMDQGMTWNIQFDILEVAMQFEYKCHEQVKMLKPYLFMYCNVSAVS